MGPTRGRRVLGVHGGLVGGGVARVDEAPPMMVSRGGGSAVVGEVQSVQGPPPREDHGTVNAYNRGCKCPECRQAKSDYENERKKRRSAEQAPADWHGKLSGYTLHKCRCVECRRVHADYQHRNRGYKTRRGENMPSDFPGLGVLRCGLCDRPYVEHRITDRCYR